MQMTRLLGVFFAMLAPVHAFVLPSARATPRKSIACVAQLPTGSGEQMVSRRSMAGHAAVSSRHLPKPTPPPP